MSPRRDPYTFADVDKEYAEEIEKAQEKREQKRQILVREKVVARIGPRKGPSQVELNIGDVELNGGDVTMAIVPLTVEIIRQGAPWILQQLFVQGLKALSVAELLEMVSGREFYSLDDVLAWVMNVLRGADVTDFVGPPALAGRRDDPKDWKKGQVREGWYIKEITDYDYGKETSKKVWYKPYEDASRGKTGAVMNFRERCAYFQGKRVQAYDSRQAKYRAYKRGYGHGSGDQFMAQAVMGHTRPCAPQLFYTKGYRGSYRGRR